MALQYSEDRFGSAKCAGHVWEGSSLSEVLSKGSGKPICYTHYEYWTSNILLLNRLEFPSAVSAGQPERVDRNANVICQLHSTQT